MLLIKIFASILVVSACSLTGYYFSKKDYFRIQDLEELKKALVLLKSEIEFSMTPLPQAMLNISERTSNSFALFFQYISDRLSEKKGEGISEIWKEGMAACLQKTYLERDDHDYFISLGNTLGFLDRHLQISNIQILIDYIDCKTESLSKISEKNKKMYGSLGVLSGLLIVILLF